MSRQTTNSVPEAEDWTLREKLEYAVGGTAEKLGLHKIANRRERARRQNRARSRLSRLFPQWLRTMLVVLIETGSAMTWLAATSTPAQMAGGITVAALHPAAVGIAAHVWPTRTAPWRTLVWTWMTSWVTASALFLVWGVDWALYAAIGVVIVITAARCNANARRLWNYLVRKNIQRKFGEDVTLKDPVDALPSASVRHAETVRRQEESKRTTRSVATSRN